MALEQVINTADIVVREAEILRMDKYCSSMFMVVVVELSSSLFFWGFFPFSPYLEPNIVSGTMY